MPEVADAFRRFAGSYVAAHGAAMLPSHRRAIADIIACRTEALGGQQWCCNHCGTLLHVFHSCRNRACPKCHAGTPSTTSTLCIAHQRATKALASVTSAKQIARASFTTPRVLDGVMVHSSDPQLASNHAFI